MLKSIIFFFSFHRTWCICNTQVHKAQIKKKILRVCLSFFCSKWCTCTIHHHPLFPFFISHRYHMYDKFSNTYIYPNFCICFLCLHNYHEYKLKKVDNSKTMVRAKYFPTCIKEEKATSKNFKRLTSHTCLCVKSLPQYRQVCNPAPVWIFLCCLML